ETIRTAFAAHEPGGLAVRVHPGTPELVYGDLDRMSQIFVHLGEYVLEACDRSTVTVDFGFHAENLVGEIAFPGDGTAMTWKLDLLMGLSEMAPDQVLTDALRPLIARGLIAAARGVLTLVDDAG